MDIFILAGQSNMAGRGNTLLLPAQYVAADPQVMCFSVKGEWAAATEPLHKDVDLRKQHRCGVGPALVCARALLHLRNKSPPDGRCIGLVPCAIGGASLDEWQKQYAGVVGDCEASKEGAVDSNPPPVQANAPWGYKPGSRNLFGAMAKRAEEAVKAAPEGSGLGGMLWYQGETDCMREDTARTYFDRFQTLVGDVRGLYPDLKIFTVAVTGTTPRLPHLVKVREAQLRAGSSEGIEGVWVVDAFGLPMFTDGLHLTTSAQVELGERMARQVYEASKPPTPAGKEADGGAGASAIAGAVSSASAGTIIADEAKGWAREEARVKRAEGDLKRIADFALSKEGSKLEAGSFSQADFASYAKTLFFLKPLPEDRLLVLGSRAGKCVMASALLYDLREIQGVDLKEIGLDTARALVAAYAESPSAVSSTASDSMKVTTPASTTATLPQPEDCTRTRQTPPSSICLAHGSFADGNYCDATLVYAQSANSDDVMMLDLARRCRQLPEGARVVTIGKPLPSLHLDIGDSRDVGEGGRAAAGEFEVAWQCQVVECLGEPAVAYVHHRVLPLG